MTYVIITNEQTIIGQPYGSYISAFDAANRLFGTDCVDWVNLNLRIEENR
jgi:ABC-type uncharacterized transport system auxiliary subunit